MKKVFLPITISIVIIALGVGFFYLYPWYQERQETKARLSAEKAAIEGLLEARKEAREDGDMSDPFGDDQRLSVLLIGLDNRAGQEFGHCDAIQLITIDKDNDRVTITAVPRGTYSQLPPGTGVTSSDYYVSNSCALGGLEYGINNIERILGEQADYLAVVGFSRTFGVLRALDLPTTETVQWLRNRHGYAIGEPQRAHNHSTFIKQMMVSRLPEEISTLDSALYKVVYSMIQTDLSYPQIEQIVQVLIDMDIDNHPEKVTLAMRPAYDVKDIPYDPEHIEEHLAETIGQISHWLSSDDYSEKSAEEIQDGLVQKIGAQLQDEEFVSWAFENQLWLQIDDDQVRHQVRWDLMMARMETLTREEQKELIGDYILEMEALDIPDWEEKGRAYLKGHLL